MRNEEIYKLLEKQDEVFNAKMTGLKAEIKAGNDIQVYKLDKLIEYQKIQNGDIRMLKDETRIWRLIHRNPKTAGVFIGLCAVGVVAIFILKNIVL